jgi:glycosyltransferase involved in cell wall biosynthesis
MHPPFDARVFHKECAALVNAGYEVHLVVPHERDEVVRGVHLHALPRPSGRLAKVLIWPWLAYRKLLSLRPRPAVCHFYDPAILPVGMVLRWHGFQVIYDVRENVAKQILTKGYLPRIVCRPVAWVYRLVERITIRGMATVHVMDSIAREYPEPRVTLRNLPKLGVEFPREQRAPVGPGRPARLVYVGGVSLVRGALTMVSLVAELKCRGVPARLRIVGPWEDVGIEPRLRAAIARAGLEQEVVATGRVPYEQALAEAAAADIGLCLLHPIPNYLNSLATKILEYMQYEVPVVASDFECWREYVTGVGSGIMVDPLSVPQAADAVQWLLSHPEEMKEMGRRGRRAVLEKYNWEREAEKLVAFYDMLLAKRAARRDSP